MKIKKTPTAHPIKAPKIGINAVNAIKKVANPLAMEPNVIYQLF